MRGQFLGGFILIVLAMVGLSFFMRGGNGASAVAATPPAATSALAASKPADPCDAISIDLPHKTYVEAARYCERHREPYFDGPADADPPSTK